MKIKHYNVSQLVIIALMITLSYILMFTGISIIPAVPHLKLEFSIIPIVIIALGINIRSAILAAFIVNMLDFFSKGSLTGLPIDQLINLIAITIFLVVIVKFEKNNKTNIGLIISVLVVSVMMIFINYFFTTPLYFGLLGMELPDNLLYYCVSVYGIFNAIKWGLVAVAYFVCYKYINIFKKKVIQMSK
ncbi:MAG: ECF transporter S component [Erysipelotrichaceae bacterium]